LLTIYIKQNRWEAETSGQDGADARRSRFGLVVTRAVARRERDGYSIGRDVRGAGVGSGAAPRGWRSARKAKAARAHTPASFFIHWVFLYAKIKFMKLPYGAVLPPL
jgi:hypothetical protein